MTLRFFLVVWFGVAFGVCGEEFRVSSLSRYGMLKWAGAFASGVCTVQRAPTPIGPWVPIQNAYTTASAGSIHLSAGTAGGFYRLGTMDLSPTAEGFKNLCAAYGVLRTVAGKGEFSGDGFNGWQPDFEGGEATAAELSRPHMAMADDAGNIFVADKDGHAIRKITPSGKIITVAGSGSKGDDGDVPGPGTQRRLASPNGLWVRPDGTVYILDLDNSKVRRLDSSGTLTTLFRVGGGINSGRGLWVRDDETLVYFASGSSLKRWTPGTGVQTVAAGFEDLGNLVADPSGMLVVTDRGANRVYRVSENGSKTPIAGNGKTSGGGDGQPALATGLLEVRGVWFLPNGGYLLATHQGSQIWYVDTAGIIHLFVDGSPGAHSGDGEYFRTSGPKLSEIRAVTVDKTGRIIITENDAGFIRTIDFIPVLDAR